MKLKRDSKPTARDLARLRYHLGEAFNHLLEVVFADGASGRRLLTIGEQDKLVRITDQLVARMYALDAPFERAVGCVPPFAPLTEPSRWLDWLDERERVLPGPSPCG